MNKNKGILNDGNDSQFNLGFCNDHGITLTVYAELCNVNQLLL